MRLEDHWRDSNTKDCPGKKTFPSYREAAEFNNRQKSRHGIFVAKGKKIERMHVYRCKRCHQFHIGHDLRTRQARLQARHQRPSSGRGREHRRKSE